MPGNTLHADYPWTSPDAPFVVAAPMMKITLGRLAVSVSANGGLGFLAGGFDLSPLAKDLGETAEFAKSQGLQLHDGILPIGVGFQNWGSDLQLALAALKEHPVAAVWFFAPKQLSDLLDWAKQIRAVSGGKTKIWVQIGTVAEALEVAKTTQPDVIVIQGADSGGHGLAQRASLLTLLPEVIDALAEERIDIPVIAAGGIVDGRGAAAALTLGAAGVALGTRFLACSEAVIAKGYQDQVLSVTDGGASTVGTTIYDVVRGIHGWPRAYNGRGIANSTYHDAEQGMSEAENVEKYETAVQQGDAGWGPEGRMTTYAGTGVGLVREVMSAGEIVKSVQKEAVQTLQRSTAKYVK
ncbi:oxidoreductase 2-nitropropane dioxygenase [Exophiala viscosa]|uniref:Oxidoreductase 2-nitropropane dioxygenase n=1 Tax=Exophiala viscosa TaxID=2486360 RepID=A0AAN6IDB6_9EURO|nr:oxidoreductase 2-nitropropane dioxygenase [Exophiala viscosa]KAI1622742.1 oxidoreductase 2-nitropropane dioxygenase [Exophiala viscosa]